MGCMNFSKNVVFTKMFEVIVKIILYALLGYEREVQYFIKCISNFSTASVQSRNKIRNKHSVFVI